jgi:hypothetical protein
MKFLPIRIMSGGQLEEDGECEGIHDDDFFVESAAVQLHHVRVGRSENYKVF